MMSRLLYFLRESLISARRNLSTTIGGTITLFLCLTMVGISILFSIMISNVVSSVEDDVDIRCYVSDDATDEQLEAFDAFLATLTNEEGNVAGVTFMDKDEVLEAFKESTSNDSDIVDLLDGNPLPRTYVVELHDQQLVSETAAAIVASEEFAAIADEEDPADSVKYGQGTVERLFLIANIIRYACAAGVVLLILISLIFLNNTIRLAILARRKEISIMRLVGASNGFIRGPFIMEGALQALVGALLAIGVISVVRYYAIPQLGEAVNWLSFDISGHTYAYIYGTLVLAGLFIGVMGSVIAMRRYLKV